MWSIPPGVVIDWLNLCAAVIITYLEISMMCVPVFFSVLTTQFRTIIYSSLFCKLVWWFPLLLFSSTLLYCKTVYYSVFNAMLESESTRTYITARYKKIFSILESHSKIILVNGYTTFLVRLRV